MNVLNVDGVSPLHICSKIINILLRSEDAGKDAEEKES